MNSTCCYSDICVSAALRERKINGVLHNKVNIKSFALSCQPKISSFESSMAWLFSNAGFISIKQDMIITTLTVSVE